MKAKDLRKRSSGASVPIGVVHFKYYIHDHAGMFRLQLLGALTSRDVPELQGCWKTAESSISGRSIQIDMRRLTSVDEAGQEWLVQISRTLPISFVAYPQSASFVPEGAHSVIESSDPGRIGAQSQKLIFALRAGARAAQAGRRQDPYVTAQEVR